MQEGTEGRREKGEAEEDVQRLNNYDHEMVPITHLL